MTLFCSVNDNPDQARKERLWALNLLKEGTVDSYCYQVASRRHVPELLLTSFDAICSRADPSADINECISLLDTIETLIQRGSFYHYFNAVGLLSWIQGSLQSILSCSIKSPAVIIVFTKLLRIVLDKAVGESSNGDCPQFDAVKVGRGIADLFKYISRDDDVDPDQASSRSTLSENVTNIGHILWSLYELIANNEDSPAPCVLHPHGLPVETTVEIITAITEHDPTLLKKTIVALSYLPFDSNAKQQQNAALIFCQKAIQLMSTSTQDISNASDAPLFSTILKRVSKLSPMIKDHKDSASLIKCIFGCRRILVTKCLCSKEWLECLSILLDDHAPLKSKSDQLSDYKNLTLLGETVGKK
jgi:hypothetical protein